jgi:hypothetical protein
MQYSNKIIKLFISHLIRVLSTLIIFYKFKIPIYKKIILLMLTDSFDCGIPRKFLNEWINCSSNIYQISDKIIDILCYTILLFYILKNGNLSTNNNNLLKYLFLFRLIGIFLFLLKNDRRYLFFFPNFFLEISLGLMFINNFKILENFKKIIFFTIIIFKIIQEYYLHIYKNKS